jgi:uncharacterized protein (TIGR02246 family)
MCTQVHEHSFTSGSRRCPIKLTTIAAVVVAVAFGPIGCGSGVPDTTDTAAGGQGMTRDADRAELERLDRQQVDAWGRDGAAFAATFTEDADFVDMMGGHFHGRAAIEDTMTQGFATFMAGTRLSEPEKWTVDFVSPEMAVVITSRNCVLRDGQSECRPEDLSIQTKVAVRQDGRWLFRTFQNTRIRP